MKSFNVVVLAGDGIGPELTDVTIQVLEALPKNGEFSLKLDHRRAGAAVYRETGRAMSDDTLAACRAAHATLKGPVGHPDVRAADGTEAGVLGGILRPARSITSSCARTRKGCTPRAVAASSRTTSCSTRW